jgi:hypothetical protein
VSNERPGGPASPENKGQHRLDGPAALRLHATLLIGLAFCASAFIFELHRAEGGNGLSWAYVFEWPLLGAFGIYMWWNVLHDGRSTKKRPRRTKPVVEPQYEGMLAAWQEHQRSLAVNQDAERQRLKPKDAP